MVAYFLIDHLSYMLYSSIAFTEGIHFALDPTYVQKIKYRVKTLEELQASGNVVCLTHAYVAYYYSHAHVHKGLDAWHFSTGSPDI